MRKSQKRIKGVKKNEATFIKGTKRRALRASRQQKERNSKGT